MTSVTRSLGVRRVAGRCAVVTLLSIAVSLLAACGSEASEQRDRVVGKIDVCYLLDQPWVGDDCVKVLCSSWDNSGDQGFRRERLMTREDCRVQNDARVPSLQPVKNRRLRLTVRTAAGPAYDIEVSPETQVSIGDLWPPSVSTDRD